MLEPLSPAGGAPPGYSTRHLAALDGMRGIAIALVLAYHFWLVTWLPTEFTLFGLRLSLEVFDQAGFTGVTAFFFISGFCLFYPYAQTLFDGRPMQPVATFAYRRMLKILPSYYAGIALWIAIGYAHFGSPMDAAWELGTHAVFVHSFWADTHGGINGVLWSLAIEVQFYVLFPALAWAAMRRPLLTVGALVVVGNAYRLVVIRLADPGLAMEQLPGLIDIFAAGMFAAWAFRALERRSPGIASRKALWTAIAFAGFCGWYGALATIFDHRFTTHWSEGWITYGAPLLELALVPATLGSLLGYRWWQRAIGNPILLAFSYLSYNLYLWHQVVAFMLADTQVTPFRASSPDTAFALRLLYTGMFLAFSLCVAWLMTTFVEQPMLRGRPFQAAFERLFVRFGNGAGRERAELVTR